MIKLFDPPEHQCAFREGVTIQAKANVDMSGIPWPGAGYVVIRKIVVKDGKIDHKEALTLEGTWVVVPEGEEYPPSTHLPMAAFHMNMNHQVF